MAQLFERQTKLEGKKEERRLKKDKNEFGCNGVGVSPSFSGVKDGCAGREEWIEKKWKYFDNKEQQNNLLFS